jgi:serine acetyltransferase
VIGEGVILKPHCVIGPNVTIGSTNTGSPKIGWGVIICANSCIIGNITIGACSVIGAGSVVVSDIPPLSVVVGNPGHVIKTLNNDDYINHRRVRT